LAEVIRIKKKQIQSCFLAQEKLLVHHHDVKFVVVLSSLGAWARSTDARKYFCFSETPKMAYQFLPNNKTVQAVTHPISDHCLFIFYDLNKRLSDKQVESVWFCNWNLFT
jgi:hypothetical protein